MLITRSKLLDSIIELFSQQPEIYNISTFGRQAIGKTDRYSDIDLLICSDDLRETQRSYKKILNNISPILGTYILRLDETEIVEMILLRDVSPYSKIDLSISSSLAGKDIFKPLKNLHRKKRQNKFATSNISTDVRYSKKINVLNERLSSIPRFTKTLFRNDQLEMYRRWQATINEYLKILMQETLSYVPEKPLHPVSFKELTAKLSASDKRNLQKILPSGKHFSIATSYRIAMSRIIRHHSARISSNPYEDFEETLVKFLNDEISRFN